MQSQFTFNGTDYQVDGVRIWAGSSLIGSIQISPVSGSWIAESSDGTAIAIGHPKQYGKLDIAKTMLSGL